MKKFFKKNQIIITALAIMIAAAGYLNYVDRDSVTPASGSDTSDAAADRIYQDDSLLTSEDDIISPEEDLDAALSGWNSENGDAAENGEASDAEGETGTAGDGADASAPGASMFVTGNSLVFVNEAKLAREQARSKTREALLEVINNKNLSDSAKEDAIDQMLAMTQYAEWETAVETGLLAKGMENTVVSIQENKVEVCVNAASVSDQERACIEDVVAEKTGMPVSSLTIVPLLGEAEETK